MNNVRKECFANKTKLSKTIKKVLKGLEQDKIQWQQNKRKASLLNSLSTGVFNAYNMNK